MGLTETPEAEPPQTLESLRGLPAEPQYDRGEIRSAISDASDIAKYVAKALKALEDEDYESVKGYLQDIEISSTSAVDAMTQMEQGLSRFEDWGDAWKQEAIGQPADVIEHLEKDWKSCLNQVTEIQADDSLSTKVADQQSEVAIRSWGISDPELAATVLAVCKLRGEELYQRRKGPQPVVPVENKIRKITGNTPRPFF